MNILLAHAGKQHSYQVAKSMEQLGVLEAYHTSGYAGSMLQWISQKIPGDPLQRRYIKELSTQKVNANWRLEFRENWLRQVKKDPVKARAAVYHRDEKFDKIVAKKLSKIDFSHYWGFQGSCREALEKANELGMSSICELATAHVTSARKVLGEESRLHPEWAFTIDNLEFPKEYERRLEEEPVIAKWVIAASEFTRQTLLDTGISRNKIKKLPLGFDIDHIPFNQNDFQSFKNRPFRLLYAGRVTQRKGIKYLLEAVKQFDPSELELHIIGNLNGSDRLLKPYQKWLKIHGSKTQLELFNSYKQFDALVLPTIFEGFGLVIVEALVAGLPVITTPNSMGPDIIEEDKNGYLIPIRDTEAIAQSISSLLSKPDDQLMQMRIEANKSAHQFSWDRYRENLSDLLKEL